MAVFKNGHKFFLHICSGTYNVSNALLRSNSASWPQPWPQLDLWPTCTRQWGRRGTVLAPSLGLRDFHASAVPLRTLLPQWRQQQVNIKEWGVNQADDAIAVLALTHERAKEEMPGCSWHQMHMWTPRSIQPSLHQKNCLAILQTMSHLCLML